MPLAIVRLGTFELIPRLSVRFSLFVSVRVHSRLHLRGFVLLPWFPTPRMDA